MALGLPVLLACVSLLAKSSWAEEAQVTGTCNPSWTPLPGSLIHISASMNYIWGVNNANHIFVCKVPCTGNWRKSKGRLKQIDADDSEVWGVNSADVVHKLAVDGSGTWSSVPGRLKHVSASGNGYIWGVNKDDRIFKCKKPCNGEWKGVDGYLSQIDGGNQFVYGVNCRHDLYFRPVDGSGKWQTPSKNGKVRYVTATGHNKVYALLMDNKVYSCDAPCADGQWVKLSDDTLAQIDGSVHLLVARNVAEQLYYKSI